MEQLRIVQATILHMVQSTQIGCITGVGIQSFIYLLLDLFVYRTMLFVFLIHTMDVLACFACESFLQSLSTTYLPSSPVSDGFDDATSSTAKQKLPPKESESETAERPRSFFSVFIVCSYFGKMIAIEAGDEGYTLEVES
jgi:hypothetical protein